MYRSTVAAASVKGHTRSPTAAVAIWRWRAQAASARKPSAMLVPRPAHTAASTAAPSQPTHPAWSRAAASSTPAMATGTNRAHRPASRLTVAGRAGPLEARGDGRGERPGRRAARSAALGGEPGPE